MSEIIENHTITNVGAGVAKAIMHSNPITGFFQTIYDEYASRQWQQRRHEWEEIFEEKLQNIQDEIDLTKIESIPNFAQILLSAGQGAMSDIEEDKVALYVNAVVNSIKNENIDDTKKHIFLNMLRDFTLLHIEALKFFRQPHQQAAGFQHQVTLSQRTMYDIIVEMEPKLDSGEAILDAVLQDLKTKSMLLIDRVDNIHISFGINKLTTDLGDEFINFISES